MKKLAVVSAIITAIFIFVCYYVNSISNSEHQTKKGVAKTVEKSADLPAKTASMPNNLLHRLYKAENMRVGEKGYLYELSVLVSQDQKVFIKKSGIVYRASFRNCVLVKREKDGYHLYVTDTDIKWEKRDLSSEEIMRTGWVIPVIKIH